MEKLTSAAASTVKTVLKNIQSAVTKSKFNQDVRLVAVSKTKPSEQVKELYDTGIRHFGENYVEELVEKSAQLPEDICWHFIGHLQSNKCKQVLVPNLWIIETIDSQKLAEKLNKTIDKIQRKNKLKVYVQVKTSDEATKSGVEPEEALSLIQFIREKCPNLEFCGLMTLGKEGDFEAFTRLADLREAVCKSLGLEIKDVELSMGMSGDYEEAVSRGSTNVRIGSLLFGAREKKEPTQTSEDQKTEPK